MACSPNDYLRIIGLVQSEIVMHFYFKNGQHVRGYVAKADLDPVTRSGFMLVVLPDSSRIIQCDAGDIVKISARGPNGALY